VADRVAVLADLHRLDRWQGEQLQRFLALLAQDPHAPTAVRDPEQAADVHLADSLAGLFVVDAALARGLPALVVDVGSGAGLPGIPVAVARPSARVGLVEATERKCAFLRQVVEHLELSNVYVRCARVEELGGEGSRESYGMVLARAVGALPVLAEYAAPLLAMQGELLAWKGRRDGAEERAGAGAALEVGLEPVAVWPVTPYEQSRNRHLHLYRKVRPCPPRFPRRPGVARRNPLA